MNLTTIIKKITTCFINGGMEYKVQCEVELQGSCIMSYKVLKVWCAYDCDKWVRVSPYDLDLWTECMDIDISKALREEI